MEVRKRHLVVAVACLATILGLLGVYFAGFDKGRSVEEEAGKTLSARDQRIISVIVKRNPQASIKDFADFPGKLTTRAADLKLDFRYVMAIIDKESEWKPQAVSSAGAVGLMQVMPETAAIVVKRMGWQGYEPPSPSRASPRYNSLGSLGEPGWNLRIGMQFLRWQIDEYGLGPEHLRAYNRGGLLARAHWPRDRYAEDIGFRLIALVNEVK